MVRENIIKSEKGFRPLLFHASLDEMMASVREGLADHINKLLRAGASDVGAEPEDEIGTVTTESAHPEGIGGTLLESGDTAIPTQELAVTAIEERQDLSEMVDDFLLRCNRESNVGFKVIRKHISLAVGHAKPRQFQYWQQRSDKATPEDDRNFRRILGMTPAEFIALLRKKGIYRPDS